MWSAGIPSDTPVTDPLPCVSGPGERSNSEREDVVCTLLLHQQSPALLPVSTSALPRGQGKSHQDFANYHGALGCCHGNVQCKRQLHYMSPSLPVVDTIRQVRAEINRPAFERKFLQGLYNLNFFPATLKVLDVSRRKYKRGRTSTCIHKTLSTGQFLPRVRGAGFVYSRL